ncbi:MAG: ABC transporter ATP-binding protein [Bacteroidales bacterium]|jgi:lipoprotein-releasing system ATP-binding protein|nr:ABC transporter ATP-binding protein [Bacteroidales bacterium]
MIQIEHLTKTFGALTVLSTVELTVSQGEVISIVGPSGAGKTTLLQILGTLDTPTSGQINICGENPFLLSNKKLANFRNKNLGFVFQFHHLLPEFSAVENVMIPAMIGRIPTAKAHSEAMHWLDFFGLSDRAQHKPHELSGGEQQRVAVARALINKPQILLADEPSGNLDSDNAERLHHLFLRLREEFGQTIIVVTHNEHLADLADRKICMKDGRIV